MAGSCNVIGSRRVTSGEVSNTLRRGESNDVSQGHVRSGVWKGRGTGKGEKRGGREGGRAGVGVGGIT